MAQSQPASAPKSPASLFSFLYHRPAFCLKATTRSRQYRVRGEPRREPLIMSVRNRSTPPQNSWHAAEITIVVRDLSAV